MGRNRKLKAIDARKFDNDVSVRPYVRTDSGSRGKNSVVREGSPRHLCCVSFWRKIKQFWGATNGFARVKIKIEVSCVRLRTKFSQINF